MNVSADPSSLSLFSRSVCLSGAAEMTNGDELKRSAKRALLLMDFTTLADDDTHERVEKLCADARFVPVLGAHLCLSQACIAW